MLNAKNVKIAYASVETEIIDDMLYVVLEDDRKIELPLYAEWCWFDPSFGDAWNDLLLYENARCGYLTFGVGDKYGYIDLETCKVACEPKWNWVSLFTPDGYAIVNCGCEPADDENMAFEIPPRGGKFGLIDRNFNVVVPIEYNYVALETRLDIGKCGSRYCNVSGNVFRVQETKLNANVPLADEWYIVSKDREYGIVNRKGDFVIPLGLGKLHVFCRDCILRKADTTLYMKGEVISLDKVYVCASMYDKRVCLIAKKGGKYAIVRTDGTFVCEFCLTFEEARQYVDGLFNGRTIIGIMV